jgi:hypothetical protein
VTVASHHHAPAARYPSIGAQIDLRARRAYESIVDTLGLDQTTGLPRSGRSASSAPLMASCQMRIPW